MGLRERLNARKQDAEDSRTNRTNRTTLVATGMGLAATVAVAYLGLHSTREDRSIAVAEDHQTEIRGKRSDFYATYLHAATVYRDVTHRTMLALAARKEAKAPYATVAPELRAFDDARRAYQDQRTLVATYGSVAAWQAQQKIAESLPRAFGTVTVTEPDYAKFSDGYRAFVAEFCKDVNPDTQPDCTQAQAVVPGSK